MNVCFSAARFEFPSWIAWFNRISRSFLTAVVWPPTVSSRLLAMNDVWFFRLCRRALLEHLLLVVAVDGLIDLVEFHPQPLQGLDVGGKLFRQTALVHALEFQNLGIQRSRFSLAVFNSSARKLVVRLAWLRCTVTFCSVNLVTSSRTTACAL